MEDPASIEGPALEEVVQPWKLVAEVDRKCYVGKLELFVAV